MVAGNPQDAAELFGRAVAIAHQTELLPWRIRDAEENLRQA
jgi:hypothetical protein